MTSKEPPTTLQGAIPRIAVTMGDPSGIGPEIVAKVLEKQDLMERVSILVVGDYTALKRAMDLVGASVELECKKDFSLPLSPRSVSVLCPEPLSPDDIVYGEPSASACRQVVASIEKATQLALAGAVDAVVTGPINKEQLHLRGFAFPGHTEFLKHLTGVPKVVMMLAGPQLRVSLATIHCRLAHVPGKLHVDDLISTIDITGHALSRDFGIPSPRIAVAGLNPHAGEGGRFGMEESEIIEPAVEACLHRPWTVSGPYPPDAIFRMAWQGQFDAVIAMYHDQGLIPIKMVHFETSVNITLGLPIVRTSVDHGTAYDIAGIGIASSKSLETAIELAARMATRRRHSSSR